MDVVGVYAKFERVVESVVAQSVAELPALLGDETMYAFAVYIDIDDYLDVDLCANTVEGRDTAKAARYRRYREERAEVQPLRLDNLTESELETVEANAANWQYSVEAVIEMMNEKRQQRLDRIEEYYGQWDEFSVGEWKYNTLSAAFPKIAKITRKAMSRRNRIRVSAKIVDAIGYEQFKGGLLTTANRVLLEFREHDRFRGLRTTDGFVAFTTIHDNDGLADLELMRAAWPSA